MQKANCIVRLNGSLTNTVPKLGVTPAEILILRVLHGGDDAVVDIRPTVFDEKVRQEGELARLRQRYDRGSSFAANPGEASKSIIEMLFPGAQKRLPTTLEEIGIDTGAAAAAAAQTSAPFPDLPPVDSDEAEEEADGETVENDEAGAGGGQGSAEAE